MLFLSGTSLHAVDYIFGYSLPMSIWLNKLPAGCSGSGVSYSCAGAIALADGDTVRIVSASPTTITMTAAFATTGNNEINSNGASSNLNLIVVGAMSLGVNSTMNAIVIGNAGAVAIAAGSTVTGSIYTDAGAISIGVGSKVSGPITALNAAIAVAVDAEVIGDMTTSSGAISVGAGASVTGNITTIVAGAIAVGAKAKVTGNLSTSSAAISIGEDGNVTGNIDITVAGDLGVGAGATVIGECTVASGVINIGATANVTGNLQTTVAGAINIGATAQVSGDITTLSGAVTLDAGSIVTGSIGTTLAGAVTVGADTHVNVQIYTANNDVITLGANAIIASVCCKLTSDVVCVVNGSLLPMPPTCSVLIANYRFDECSWDGLSGTVKDSSGNGYDGIAIHEANTESNLTAGGGIGYVGKFVSANKQHVEISNFPTLRDSRTITAWIKVNDLDKNGRIFADDESNSDGDYALSYRDPGSGRVRFYIRGLSTVSLDSNQEILENQWYFIVATFDSIAMKKELYIYDTSGNLKDHVTQTVSGTLNLSGGHATIGGEASSGSEANSIQFDGNIDEVKIFNNALNDAQIVQMYTNEKDKYNYDSTARAPVICGLVMCFTDDYSRTSLGSKWSIISTGTYPPNVTENKLMLTQNFTNISSGVSLVGDFPSSNNLVEIEFEHNAYAGDGADGVTVILSDANIAPVAGGFGGSLGYSPKNGTLGFAGAWLGFGLDEYGNFSNDNDGDKTLGCSDGPTTSVQDSVTIRGRGGADRLTGYCFITNSGNLATLTGTGIDNTASSTPAPKNKYKLTIDTRSGTRITVMRDINDGNGYVILPNMDEVDATQTAVAPSNFKLSFTGSTGGSKNYHSFDDLSIKALDCGTLGEDQNNINSSFDAWEIGSAYNASNRIIQTKIVKSNFNLNIFAMNEENTNYQDFNGTVCARIVSSYDENLTEWSKMLFNEASPYVNQAVFNSSYANMDSRVALSWKKDVDTICPISIEDNSTKSTDHFAIRPDKFVISHTTSAYAGENFKLDFKALNAANANSLDYNEPKDGSFAITSVISKIGCNNGLLNVANFSFTDGQNILVDSNFSDVGDINITIAERATFEFAKIDAIDTSDTNRLIMPYTAVITVTPYELNVTNVIYRASTGNDWVYMADVNILSQQVQSTIQANDKYHNILQNFTDVCYAKDITIENIFEVLNTNSNVVLSYNVLAGEMLDVSKNITDINKVITIPATLFIGASKADAHYEFNVDRSYLEPYNPIKIGLRHINITSANIAKVKNNMTVDLNTSFYYGRVKTEDISTNKSSTQHSLHLEVYSQNPLSNFPQNSLNWYRNSADSITSIVDFYPRYGFSMSDKIDNNIDDINATQTIAQGIIGFNITNNKPSVSNSATIHVALPEFLWSSRYNDYNASGDCSMHPCFRYNYVFDRKNIGIRSGDFNGTTIGSEYQATKIKKGLKIFR